VYEKFTSDKDMDSRIAAAIAAATIGRGTSLPGSPTDGQLYELVDSLTTPTWSWLLRYAAGSSNADKWEFIGGPPKASITSPGGTGSSTSAVDVPGGASLVIPRSGVYIATWVNGAGNNGINGDIFWLNVNGTDVDSMSFTHRGANDVIWGTRFYGPVAATAGHTWKTRYQVSGGTATFTHVSISLMPVRIS
jgi:hypothetical protein